MVLTLIIVINCLTIATNIWTHRRLRRAQRMLADTNKTLADLGSAGVTPKT